MGFDITQMGSLNTQEAQTLSEYIFKMVKEDGILSEFYTIMEGIEQDKYVPIIGNMDDILESMDGDECEFPEGGEIGVSTKTWSPKVAGQEQKWCKDKFEARLRAFLNQPKDLLERYDLTGTPLGDFLVREISLSIVRATKRIADFGDTDASLIGSGSGSETITASLGARGVKLMNRIDGFWKQAFASVSAGDTERITITQNGLATKTAQMNLADDTAVNLFSSMILAGGDEVDGGVIHCTKELWDNYFVWAVKNKQDVSDATENKDYKSVTLSNYGVKLINRKDWSKTIKKYYDNGTVYDMPHRALYSTKENLLIGTPSNEALASFSSHYSQDLLKQITRSQVKLDAKIALDEGIVAGY